MQAHEVQVAKDRVYMTAVAKLNANAIAQQEERRVSEQAERKRVVDEALAKAQAQELVFQDDRSAASSVVRKKHGTGGRGNLEQVLNPPIRMRKSNRSNMLETKKR